MHRCALVAKQERVERYHIVDESEMHKEGRDVLEEEMGKTGESMTRRRRRKAISERRTLTWKKILHYSRK